MMPLMSEEDKFEMMPIFFFTSGQILRVSYKIETESEVGPNMRQETRPISPGQHLEYALNLMKRLGNTDTGNI